MSEFYLLAFTFVMFYRSKILVDRSISISGSAYIKAGDRALNYMINQGVICSLLGYVALITSLVIWYRG